MNNSGDAIITISAKDLTKAAFDAARASLKGLKTETDNTSSGLSKLASAFGVPTSAAGALKGAIGALGVSLSIAAVTSWISSTIEAGGRVDDLSKRLKVSTDAVQRWDYAISLSGGTMDDVAKAVDFVSKSLGEGDTSYVESLHKVGLEYETLRTMKQEDAFNAIATAVGNIKDPMAQAARSTELFSKGGQAMSAALAEGFVETGKGASVMSAETIARLDAAGDAWTTLGNTAKMWSGEIIAGAMNAVSQPPGEDAYLQKWLDALHLNTAQAKADLTSLGQWLDVLRGKMDLPKLPAVPKVDLGATFKPKTFSVEDLEAEVKSLEKEKEALKKASTEADAHAKALKKLTESFNGLGAVIEARDLFKALHGIDDVSKLSKTSAEALAAAARKLADDMNQSNPAQKQYYNILRDIERQAALTAIGLEKLDLVASKPLAGLSGKQFGEDGVLRDSIPLIERNLMIDKLHGAMTASFGPDLWKEITLTASAGGHEIGQKLGTSMLDALAASTAQLSQIMGTKFSGITQSLGSVIGGFSTAGKGFDAIGTSGASMTSKIAGLATMATGYGAVAMAAISAGKAIFHAMTDGRKAVEDFANSQGGFDALHQQMAILGPDAERLWIQLTQKTGKGDQNAAKRVIDEITAALDKEKTKQAEVAKATEEAAATQAAAIEAIAAKYAEQLSALDSEYKTLSDSVGQEADEAERGIQETRDRARMEQIEAEKKRIEDQKAAEIDASNENYDAQVEAAKDADARIREIFAKPMRIPVEFEYPGDPTGGSSGRPSASSPAAQAAAAGRAGAAGQTVISRVYLDSKVLAESTMRNRKAVLAAYGVTGR